MVIYKYDQLLTTVSCYSRSELSAVVLQSMYKHQGHVCIYYVNGIALNLNGQCCSSGSRG